MSVLIRPIPAIRGNLVVLAIVVFLAIHWFPTKLSSLEKMTPAIHKFADNFDSAIGVANVIARRSAVVRYCFPMEYKHVLVLPGAQLQQEIWLPSDLNTYRLWYRVRSGRVAS